MNTLLKKSWRTDSIWTHPLVFKSFLKYIPLYFDTRALMKSQYWSRQKIEHLQDERLRALFKDAPKVAFWRDVFEKARVDLNSPPREILRTLPIVPKKQLASQSPEYSSDQSLIPRSDPDHTSGSTGTPFNFYFDWHAGLRSFAFTERAFRTATGGRRYPIVYMRWRSRNGFTPWRHIWFFLRGFHGIAHRLEEFKKIGKQYPAGFILYGYTSSVVEVARQMEKNNMHLPIRAALATGEGITDSDRALVERVMQTKFKMVYASREAGYLAYQCEEDNLHLAEEWAHIEIVDENGQSLPCGKEGRVIVTDFDNRIMPFIRYELGDQGIISDAPCPCGRTLRTITLRGRTAELIEIDGGRRVALLDVTSAIDRFWDAIRQFQIVQTGGMSLMIKVVPGPAFEEKKQTLELLLTQLLHPNMQITWQLVEAIPEAKSGKAVYFVRDFGNK